MRSVTLPDGRTRPAHTAETIEQVGSITNTYAPTCHIHHQVWDPGSANLFDHGFDLEDVRLKDGQYATFWNSFAKIAALRQAKSSPASA